MDDFTAGVGDKVRIGDAERDSAAAALSEHYSAGRLDRAEFDARLADALAARTRDDLAPLFADLPRDGRLVEDETRPPGPVWPDRGFALPRVLIPLLLVLAIGATVHGHPPFFLLIPLVWLLVRARCRGAVRPGPR